MHLIGDLGHSAILLPASLVLILLLVQARRRQDALAFIVALAGCLIGTLVGKLAIHACQAQVLAIAVASPSGHASFSTAFYGCLALILAAGREDWQRAAIYVGTAALAISIGLSRVLVVAHTWPDVAIGLSIGALSVLVFQLLRGPPRPVAMSARALAVGLPVGALLIVGILLAARQWTPEPLIERAALRLDTFLSLCV